MAQAYDNGIELNGTGSGTSTTTAFTVGSGSDRVLLVWSLTTGGDKLSGVTYNGVSLTLLDKTLEDPTGDNVESYWHALLNPDSGTHDIVQSATGTTLIIGAAVSYDGVTGIGAHAANVLGSNNTNFTQTLTVSANSWLAAQFRACFGSAPAVPTSVIGTDRISGTAGGYLWNDSNGQLSAGSNSLEAVAGAQFWVGGIIELQSGGGGGSDQPMMRRWGAFQPVPGVGQSSGGGKGWG